MPFIYTRRIHFKDTDAAGVVYFANILSMCHEAYEASLVASGIDVKKFFTNPELVIPIVHVQSDFLKPMFCGDEHHICLIPHLVSSTEFSIVYEIGALPKDGLSQNGNWQSAKALSRHVAIHPRNRRRVDLPASILNWLTEWGDGDRPIE